MSSVKYLQRVNYRYNCTLIIRPLNQRFSIIDFLKAELIKLPKTLMNMCSVISFRLKWLMSYNVCALVFLEII